MKARFALLSAAVLAGTCFLLPGAVARADSKETQSLDDKLLESLNADPLDEFDRELFAPADGKAKPPDRPGPEQRILGKDPDDWKRELLRELEAAAVSEEENPLLDVARQMRQVEGLIAGTESGPKTQGIEREIVSRLDELIKQARSCCKKSSSSKCSPKVAARRQVSQPKKQSKGQGKPTQKRVNNPITRPGKADSQALTPDQMKELVKSIWGELPESEREQMLQWAGDKFLPKYELLIELYFRRLADQTPRMKNE